MVLTRQSFRALAGLALALNISLAFLVAVASPQIAAGFIHAVRCTAFVSLLSVWVVLGDEQKRGLLLA